MLLGIAMGTQNAVARDASGPGPDHDRLDAHDLTGTGPRTPRRPDGAAPPPRPASPLRPRHVPRSPRGALLLGHTELILVLALALLLLVVTSVVAHRLSAFRPRLGRATVMRLAGRLVWAPLAARVFRAL
ncbi:hypothetical protein GCM10023238_22620 [Streptomyces heliomycini]